MQRPSPGEFAPYYAKYVELVAGSDVVESLRGQVLGTLTTLRMVSAEASLRRYADGKWSLREVVGHMIDTERIMAYRALRFARADGTELATFDQDAYAVTAGFDSRDWGGLVDEFELVRRANVLMFEGFVAEAWARGGVASGKSVTVRALAFIIAGHELHHMGIVRERYLG